MHKYLKIKLILSNFEKKLDRHFLSTQSVLIVYKKKRVQLQ